MRYLVLVIVQFESEEESFFAQNKEPGALKIESWMYCNIFFFLTHQIYHKFFQIAVKARSKKKKKNCCDERLNVSRKTFSFRDFSFSSRRAFSSFFFMDDIFIYLFIYFFLGRRVWNVAEYFFVFCWRRHNRWVEI